MLFNQIESTFASLISRVFVEADMIFFCVYAEFHIILFEIFSNNFLHISLMKFFFYKSLLV